MRHRILGDSLIKQRHEQCCKEDLCFVCLRPKESGGDFVMVEHGQVGRILVHRACSRGVEVLDG